MAEQRSEQHFDPVVVAMERVLEAERAAETMLQSRRKEAEALIAAARERAATITRRADARVTRLHTAYRDKIDADIASLPQPPAAASELVSGFTADADLVSAAQRLAANLTGNP